MIASIAPNRLYPGYQNFLSRVRRGASAGTGRHVFGPKAEDTSGEAARKTSGAERPDLQCYMGLDLVFNLSIKPAVARLTNSKVIAKGGTARSSLKSDIIFRKTSWSEFKNHC